MCTTWTLSVTLQGVCTFYSTDKRRPDALLIFHWTF